MIKICTKCKIEKLKSKFYKYKRNKDGLTSWCKVCKNKANSSYQRSDRGKIAAGLYRRTINGHLRDCYYNIKQRCNNSTCAAYKNYGRRGIENRFASSDEFVNYVINTLQIDPIGLEVDRMDNNGHYEPDNIRFVIHAVNQNNKRNNR